VRRYGSVAAVCVLPKTTREKESGTRKGEGTLVRTMTPIAVARKGSMRLMSSYYLFVEKRGGRRWGGAFDVFVQQ
jgi:hypothetical protein